MLSGRFAVIIRDVQRIRLSTMELYNLMNADLAPISDWQSIDGIVAKTQEMAIMTDDIETADLIVKSRPVDGLKGYTAWKIAARRFDLVERQIEKITKNYPPKGSSFGLPMKYPSSSFDLPIIQTRGIYQGWFYSEGYTIDDHEAETKSK